MDDIAKNNSINIEEELKNSYVEYAMSVIIEELYLMQEMIKARSEELVQWMF